MSRGAPGRRLKQLVWLLSVPLVLLLGLWLLRATSTLFAELTRAATVDAALNLTEPRRAAAGRLMWLPDLPTPRDLEPFVRDRITSDYLLGFEELLYAAAASDGSGLRTYFQGAALADAELAVAAASGRFVAWDHRLELSFYAPDGATVAFRDRYRYAQGVEALPDHEGLRVAEREVAVVATLDDGTWRVRRWQVFADEVMAGTPLVDPAAAQRLATARGVNYTPRSAPFDAFWPGFDADEVAADLARVRSLGFDTVRFFIPYPAPEGLHDRFGRLLEMAEAEGLQLIPTLLDGYTRYAPEDLPAVDRHLLDLAELLSHPSVLAVDVKNEADRDFAAVGAARVRSFLAYVLARTRGLSGKPVLVGTAEPDGPLAAVADAVSLHHYGPASDLTERLARAEALGRPVLLEEVGFHSWRRKLPDPHTEAEQAAYFAEVLAQVGDRGWLVWTLYDLPTGRMPGGRGVERHLGVLAADGRAKPAVAALTGDPVARPTWRDRAGKVGPVVMAFLLLVLLVALPLLAALTWWRRRALPRG